MPKSSNRGLVGRNGTVTVIEQPVMRSYARKAKIVFIITWAGIGLLAATVLASKWESSYGKTGAALLALLAGGLLGLVLAAITASVVAAWPVIRAIWWWLPELAMVGGLVTGWTELAAHTGLIMRLAVTVTVTAIPAAVRPVRRRVYALAWCLVSRHRIRTCFAEFIVRNNIGSLPLVLMARPTPAGERLWVWLRPGMSLADIQGDNADKVAAACWAASVTAEAANPSNSALVRIDIKRRDPLTGTVTSPLTAMTSGFSFRGKHAQAPAPVALDLDDVTAADVTPEKRESAAARPRWPHAPAAAPSGLAAAADESGIEDWL